MFSCLKPAAVLFCCFNFFLGAVTGSVTAQETTARAKSTEISPEKLTAELPKLTTLSDPQIKFKVPQLPFVILRRAEIEIAIGNNEAITEGDLAGHRAGYSGAVSLLHTKRKDNMFVPAYAGLNFEHILDGTVQPREILFEPRNAPMELRVIDEHTAELYQAPTPHYGLESVHRYQLLEDGTIEMTFECIPRRATFENGYIGLFWASYIHQPESLDIHFKGRAADDDVKAASQWIRGVTPQHGVLSTHLGQADKRVFAHADDFPLTLVFNRSKYVYTQPWYYGVSRGMALVYMFRPQDEIRLTQSPSGGGNGNPAWDFQYFIPDYRVDERYQFVMRAMYLPFKSSDQVERDTLKNRRELGSQ